MIDLEEVNYINNLIDIYGSLLSLKQREYLAMSYQDNLSISEISQIEHVSRAAVLDAIIKGKENLIMYENKMHLLKFIQDETNKNDEKINEVIDRLKEALFDGI